MIWLIVPYVTIMWLLGGQLAKIIRPTAIPLGIVAIGALWGIYGLVAPLPALLYGGILTIGYGEDSKLMKWLHNETMVRLVYALLCCIPVALMCWLTWQPWKLWGCLLIITAFQIRAGRLGKIGKYDILIPDIARGGAVGWSVAWSLS